MSGMIANKNKIKNILLISQEYPSDDQPKEITPVVHFFAKEWVKMGYNVEVFHLPSNFPRLLYLIANPFRNFLMSLTGIDVRTYSLNVMDYNKDEVSIHRFPLKKTKPHSRFSEKELKLTIDYIINKCNSIGFVPDVIIGHWLNPALDIINRLKKIWHIPSCIVLHGIDKNFRSIYGNEWQSLISEINVIGYRSRSIKETFESVQGKIDNCFFAFSGIPESYINYGLHRDMRQCKNFSYVGILMKRKHPMAVLKALELSGIEGWNLNIIGSGKEKDSLVKEYKKFKGSGYLNLPGRLSREDVQNILLNSDVFAMISEHETFGLVYLEAMAAGCITIASRNGGFDGIIKDGVNGFLCREGDELELAKIFNYIKNLSIKERQSISNKAIETASRMTDKMVAANYINFIEQCVIR